MMIDCPSCATAYHLTQQAIGAGRAVICPRCAAQWFVAGSGAAPQVRVEAVARSTAFQPEPQATTRRPPRPAARRKGWRGTSLAASLALAALALAFSAPILHRLPSSHVLAARLGLAQPGAGLAVRGLAGTRTSDTEAATLAVRGEIANLHGTSAGVPNLTISIADAAGQEVYRWTSPPPVRRLAPGAAAAFEIDVPRVPPAGHAIAVRFAAADAL